MEEEGSKVATPGEGEQERQEGGKHEEWREERGRERQSGWRRGGQSKGNAEAFENSGRA